MERYARSRELYERACKVLAGGVSSEFRKFSYPHPLFYTHGTGSHVFDVDGNAYLDFTLSQGPLILGHSPPAVLAAVAAASERGQLFGGQHLAELDLAETIQRLIPCAELLRFCLDGSEAVHTALRLARAHTGRPRFLRFEGHYHGWLDNVAFGLTAADEAALGPRTQPTPQPWTAGLPERVFEEAFVLPWNDLALVEQLLAAHHQQVAAIILEPIMCNSSCIEPRPGYLAGLRQLCDQYGIVLIFDEVITGFRVALGGAQTHYDVTPDLTIFAKAVANGYPLSVLAGKRSVMQLLERGTVIHAGTMNSGVPGVAAAQATLAILERDHVHDRLHALGQRLMAGLRAAARASGHQLLVQGPGPMFHAGFTAASAVSDYRDTFAYNRASNTTFLQGLHDRGIRVIGRGLWYLSAAHTAEEIDFAVDIAHDVLRELPI